jgi:hypothetical protein
MGESFIKFIVIIIYKQSNDERKGNHFCYSDWITWDESVLFADKKGT